VFPHVPFRLRAVWAALIVLHRGEPEALGRDETGHAEHVTVMFVPVPQ